MQNKVVSSSFTLRGSALQNCWNLHTARSGAAGVGRVRRRVRFAVFITIWTLLITTVQCISETQKSAVEQFFAPRRWKSRLKVKATDNSFRQNSHCPLKGLLQRWSREPNVSSQRFKRNSRVRPRIDISRTYPFETKEKNARCSRPRSVTKDTSSVARAGGGGGGGGLICQK